MDQRQPPAQRHVALSGRIVADVSYRRIVADVSHDALQGEGFKGLRVKGEGCEVQG